MYIASGKIILDFYNNDSIGKKKSNLTSLVKEVHQKFNVSAVEVADFDDPERCVIGISLVASTQRSAKAAIDKVLEHIDTHAFARVVVEDTDVYAYD
ncbi:MAG: DUF503 family protein [Bacteriovoracia bacterium]